MAKNIALKMLMWMGALFIICYLGLSLFPISSGAVDQANYFISPSGFNFLQRLTNWDGGAYLDIAEKGYGHFDTSYAFFPFYPLTIKFVSFLTLGNYLISGLLVSWISLFFSLYFLYKLVKLDFGSKLAEKTLNYLLLFPFSFFFLTTYTESIYLFLTVSSFYLFRRSMYLKSSILGAFSSATRIIGISLFIALLFELPEKAKLVKNKRSLYILLIPAGLLSYMYYLLVTKGDFLYFLTTVDKYWQRDQITYPFKVLLSYVKNMLLHPNNPFLARDGAIICLEFIVSLVFLILIIYVWFRIRKSYAVYAFLAWSFPLITGRTGSMLRYVIILFPCFMAMAFIGAKYKKVHMFYVLLSGMLLAIFAVSFVNSYWVA